MMTAAYLISRIPLSALGFKTPEELWTGKPTNYSYLRVFGCAAYAHQSVGKLEARSLRCIFLGYPEGTKGYRLLLRDQPGVKLIISKDVVFNEDEMPRLKTNPAGTTEQKSTNTMQVEEAYYFEFEIQPLSDTFQFQVAERSQID